MNDDHFAMMMEVYVLNVVDSTLEVKVGCEEESIADNDEYLCNGWIGGN